MSDYTDLLARLRKYEPTLGVYDDAADAIESLQAQLAEALEILQETYLLADWWINRTDLRGMSENDYKTWHALGYSSKAYRSARAFLAKHKEQKP